MAIKANLQIDQGADFSTEIDVLDDNGDIVNLTGYSGAAQMRKHYTSSTATNFNVAINASGGTVTLSMNAATSANVTPGRYVYDCELTSAGNTVSRLVEGIVTVTPQVTR
jgi:hypothetical protein